MPTAELSFIKFKTQNKKKYECAESTEHDENMTHIILITPNERQQKEGNTRGTHLIKTQNSMVHFHKFFSRLYGLCRNVFLLTEWKIQSVVDCFSPNALRVNAFFAMLLLVYNFLAFTSCYY